MDEMMNEALDLIRQNGKVYMACMGEGGYPNVTVKGVKVEADNTLVYHDRSDGRTVQLLKESPRVLINVLREKDPYRGYKLKGTVAFEPYPETENTVTIRVQIEQVFPY